MKEMPLISVIIPVFNVEKYLINCIESVISQTYKRIEIILVNDGSTDNSGNICDKYEKKDSRIKVIHKENGGLSDARNFGIENSNGQYITFIDSDDDIENYYIEYLYNLLLKYKTKMSIAAYTIISKDKKINIGQGYDEKLLSTEECLNRILSEKGFTISSCAKLYNKDLFNDIRFPKGKLNEDNGTTYKLILKCDEIAYGDKSIYNYYKRENSIMTSSFNIKKIDLIELTDLMCIDIISKYPKLEKVCEMRQVNARFSILRQMIGKKLDKIEKKEKQKIKKFILKKKKYILFNKEYGKRNKFALIALILGDVFFAFSWKMYSKIKY